MAVASLGGVGLVIHKSPDKVCIEVRRDFGFTNFSAVSILTILTEQMVLLAGAQLHND